MDDDASLGADAVEVDAASVEVGDGVVVGVGNVESFDITLVGVLCACVDFLTVVLT